MGLKQARITERWKKAKHSPNHFFRIFGLYNQKPHPMFLPTMSREEMRHEFELDRTSVYNKVRYEFRAIEKHMRKYKMTSYEKYTEFRSARKNNWTIVWSMISGELTQSIFCKFNLYQKFATIAHNYDSDELMYTTSHFFSRYNERLNLQLHSTNEVVRHYHRYNYTAITHYLSENPENPAAIYFQLERGLAPGLFHRHIKFIELRTFINNDNLTGSKSEISASLISTLQRWLERNGPNADCNKRKNQEPEESSGLDWSHLSDLQWVTEMLRQSKNR
jgi:hypothetical protein